MALRVLNFPNSYRVETTEKAGRQLGIVQRVALFNAQEQAAARGPAELGQIEQREMRPRQTAQRQRAENAEQPANRTVSSNKMGMNIGQLYSGRPPTLIG